MMLSIHIQSANKFYMRKLLSILLNLLQKASMAQFSPTDKPDVAKPIQ